MIKKFITMAMLSCFILKQATAFTPIPITSGFNADLIANGIGPASVSSSPFDIPNDYAMLAADFQITSSSPLPGVGLPVSGTINSANTAGLTFQLGNYSQNNALLLTETNNSGMLACTATGYAALSILGTATNGDVITSATIHFDDGTTQTISNVFFNDWYYGLAYTISGIGRIHRSDNTIEGIGDDNPRLYEAFIQLDPVNYSKNITGISFAGGISNETTLAILAISGVPLCNGMPANSDVVSTDGSVCSGTAFGLSLSTNYTTGGIEYNWQQSSDSINWTSIAAGNVAATIILTQSVATYYRCSITCTGSSQTFVTAGIQILQSPISVCYCTPTYEYGCSLYGNGGDIVSLNLIGDNGTQISTSGDDCGFGYTNYMETVAAPTLSAGMNYSVALTFPVDEGGTGDPSVSVWIDYNDDGYFDASELAGQENPFTSPDLTINLMGATAGTHRMRVTAAYFLYDEEMTSCGSYLLGETEDYMVNIVSDILPITLKSIEAKNSGAVNFVKWETATEATGDYFELERSENAKEFEHLANIAAKGIASDYSYADVDPLPGINYYRLKMLTANGKSIYSKVVHAVVPNDKLQTIVAYPNPVKDVVTLNVYNSANGQVILTDISGSIISQMQMKGSSIQINMSGLVKGIYLIRYIDNNINKIMKVSKQ